MRLITYFFYYLSFLFLFGAGSSALAVPESKLHLVYQLLEEQNLFSVSQFKGANDINIKYLQFGQEKGTRGSIVFVHGLSENIYKYVELFYDLHLQGWSPIYAYDHRGQGLSDPTLENTIAHYVEDYSFYRNDLETFIDLILSDKVVNKDKLFLIAHSMGATVVTDYLQNNPESQIFRATVFSSPLFGIATDSYSIVNPLIFASTRFMCWVSDCLIPVVSKNSRHFSREKVKKRVTNSTERFKLLSHVSRHYLPEHVTSVPSYNWVLKTLLAIKKIMKKSNIMNIQTPILILQAREDIVVSNKRQNQFCQTIPDYCRIKVIEGRHDNFIEKDSNRDIAILELMRFFQRHSESI